MTVIVDPATVIAGYICAVHQKIKDFLHPSQGVNVHPKIVSFDEWMRLHDEALDARISEEIDRHHEEKALRESESS